MLQSREKYVFSIGICILKPRPKEIRSQKYISQEYSTEDIEERKYKHRTSEGLHQGSKEVCKLASITQVMHRSLTILS